MADETPAGTVHPALRIVAGFGCLVFLALAVLFFPIPLENIPAQPWRLSGPLGAVVGAVYCGRIAWTGRRSQQT